MRTTTIDMDGCKNNKNNKNHDGNSTDNGGGVGTVFPIYMCVYVCM
jgi:hypothetical protein